MEVYVAIVDNTAALDHTFKDSSSASEDFTPKSYDLDVSIVSTGDASLCPNQCSNNGQCLPKGFINTR